MSSLKDNKTCALLEQYLTSLACIEAGYDWLAFEIDEHYFKLATERIENYTAQMSLFRRDIMPLFPPRNFAQLIGILSLMLRMTTLIIWRMSWFTPSLLSRLRCR